jgi:tetratricopeptide (TPR) repeat protein
MRALSLLGALAFERGSLDDAQAELLEALELARRLGDRLVGPRILNNLASVAHVQGRIPEALERYHEAITMYQGDRNDRGLAETYYNIGLVQRQEKAWSEAHESLRRAMRHALVVAEASLQALVHMGSAELYLDQGDFQRAQEHIDVAGARGWNWNRGTQKRRIAMRRLAKPWQPRVEIHSSNLSAPPSRPPRCKVWEPTKRRPNTTESPRP